MLFSHIHLNVQCPGEHQNFSSLFSTGENSPRNFGKNSVTFISTRLLSESLSFSHQINFLWTWIFFLLIHTFSSYLCTWKIVHKSFSLKSCWLEIFLNFWNFPIKWVTLPMFFPEKNITFKSSYSMQGLWSELSSDMQSSWTQVIWDCQDDKRKEWLTHTAGEGWGTGERGLWYVHLTEHYYQVSYREVPRDFCWNQVR